MSHYKRQANANRDALFGGPSSSSKSSSNSHSAPSGKSVSKPRTSASRSSAAENNGAVRSEKNSKHIPTLSGPARISMLKEAEEYRKKAKQAMTKTLFSSQDPIGASMYYHRAAEAYKKCNENRLERLHRIASGDCQMGHGAYASAAQEFTRAAELSEISEEIDSRKRNECCKMYGDASKAWCEIGEMGKAGECLLKSGISLLIGVDEGHENDTPNDCKGLEQHDNKRNLMDMDRKALKVIEEAVEFHVPDPLNRCYKFRQTGDSAYSVKNDSEESESGTGTVQDNIDEATLDICRENLVTTSYAHETVMKAVYKFLEFGEYPSALYAAGAVTCLLEADKFVTISLSRAYCVETIVALAMGDVVAADKSFVEVHLQHTPYLSSRECKLSEDLIRAIKTRNWDDLDEARSSKGSNRSALGNLDVTMRKVVSNLRVSGVARSEKNKTHNTSISNTTTKAVDTLACKLSTSEISSASAVRDANFSEMDNLMNDMGLNSEDDNSLDQGNTRISDDDDDDFDLR